MPYRSKRWFGALGPRVSLAYFPVPFVFSLLVYKSKAYLLFLSGLFRAEIPLIRGAPAHYRHKCATSCLCPSCLKDWEAAVAPELPISGGCVKELPILFSGPMVRAILEGRKTQTRRVVKPSRYRHEIDEEGIWFEDEYGDWNKGPCPYGQFGDRLWVREKVGIGRATGLAYYPDTLNGREPGALFDRWTPSIHMPRWASRITLEITGVCGERLQQISEEDAKAEGATPYDPTAYFTIGQCGSKAGLPDFEYRAGFAELWNSLAKPGATWSDNPWVWVIEFKRVAP